MLPLLATIACDPQRQGAEDAVAFRDVTVIPMTGTDPLSMQTVVIENGRIAAIGPSAEVAVPAGTTVVMPQAPATTPGIKIAATHIMETR